MNEIFKLGMKLFLKLLIVGIMCFFICISMSVLCTAAFTKNIGYTAYGTTSDSSEQKELYTYYSADGEDTKKAEYEEDGYTVTTSSIRSELSGGGEAAYLIITQLFCILMLIAFIYPNLWQIGTSDSNLVRFKHKAEDKFKGLKIGMVAVAPSILLLIGLMICGLGALPDLPVQLYKFLNCAFFSLIQVIIGNAATASQLGAVQYLLLFLIQLIIPLTAYIGYLLGYKDISLGEKFIYKKNTNKK